MALDAKPAGTTTSTETVDDDIRCWRWVVLASAFTTMLLNAAVSYNVGVLNVAVMDNYDGVGVEMVSWLMAVYGAMFAITAPVSSAVINMTNCRTCMFISGLLTCLGWVASSLVTRPAWLFLTLSTVGLGQSMAQVGGSVGLAYYFPTRTVFASGIALSGNGLGSFLHPALLQVLVDEYSLKGALLILGAVCLNSSVCGLLIRPTKFETRTRLERAEAEPRSFYLSVKAAWRTYSEILLDGNFLRLLLVTFTYALAYNTSLVFFPECLIHSKGFTRMEAATIASFVGIGSLISRFLVGFAATEAKIGEKLVYIGTNLISFFMCMVADTLMNYTVGAYTVALSYGVYSSPCMILHFTLTFYVLGYEKGASGYGIVLMVYGIGSLVGPPLYAILMQNFGYTALFKISGLSFLVSALVCFGVHPQTASTPVAEGISADNLSLAIKNMDAVFGSRNFEFVVAPKEGGNGAVQKPSYEGDAVGEKPKCGEEEDFQNLEMVDVGGEQESLLSTSFQTAEKV